MEVCISRMKRERGRQHEIFKEIRAESLSGLIDESDIKAQQIPSSKKERKKKERKGFLECGK